MSSCQVIGMLADDLRQQRVFELVGPLGRQQGCGRVVASHERLHAFVLREQELAEVRLRKSGGEPMAIVVALGAFETPEPIKEF